MSGGAYHSVTCWAVDCDGIGCDCWCHDDGPNDDDKEVE